MQLFLKVRHSHHQVRGMLTDIANLKSSRIIELVLYREIPLLRNGGLDVWIPQTNQRILKQVCGWRQEPLPGRGCGETGQVVRFKLGTGERGIHG